MVTGAKKTAQELGGKQSVVEIEEDVTQLEEIQIANTVNVDPVVMMVRDVDDSQKIILNPPIIPPPHQAVHYLVPPMPMHTETQILPAQ